MAIEMGYHLPTASEMQQDFAGANEFSVEDLKENQAGRISASQMAKLSLQALTPLFSSGATLAGWFLFLYILRAILPGFAQSYLLKDASIGILPITIGAVGAFLMGVLTTSRLTFLLMQDLSAGLAAKFEGRVSGSWEEKPCHGMSRLYGATEPHYSYVIKDTYFEVSEAGHKLLTTKYDTYRPTVKLYYAPKSKLLLAVEPV